MIRKIRNIKWLVLAALAMIPCLTSGGISTSFFIHRPSGDVRPTHLEHPKVEGMTYCFGHRNPVLISTNDSGYFYYEVDYFYTELTSKSHLYLIHAKAEFTSGLTAYKNGDKSFSKMYDLHEGYIHMRVSQRRSGSKRSSTINYVTSWPSSSLLNSTYTSSTGLSVSLGIGREIEAGNTVKVKNSTSFSISISGSDTVSIYGPEPTISSQYSPSDSSERQWSYAHAGLGKVTYSLSTFYMFEAVNDGRGYQDYSFDLNLDIVMKNVKYKGFWWQHIKDTEMSTTIPFGMY